MLDQNSGNRFWYVDVALPPREIVGKLITLSPSVYLVKKHEPPADGETDGIKACTSHLQLHRRIRKHIGY